MINTIIYDLDGTLLNTIEDLTESINFALKIFNLPQKTVGETAKALGNGIKKLVELSVPCGQNNPQFKQILEVFTKHYTANMHNKTKPYDGIIDMLKTFKTKGFKQAIVSNKIDGAVQELNEIFFKNYILAAAGESQSVRKKPAPDSVFAVLKKLNSAPATAVYIGDSEVDIQTAQNAGLPCISVSWGFRQKDFLLKNGAKYVADTPQQIYAILEDINK